MYCIYTALQNIHLLVQGCMKKTKRTWTKLQLLRAGFLKYLRTGANIRPWRVNYQAETYFYWLIIVQDENVFLRHSTRFSYCSLSTVNAKKKRHINLPWHLIVRLHKLICHKLTVSMQLWVGKVCQVFLSRLSWTYRSWIKMLYWTHESEGNLAR